MNCISVLTFLSIFYLVSGTIRYRLPTSVKPSYYAIKLQPDLDNEVFNGSVLIYAKVETHIESIILHSSELNITNLYLNTVKLNYNPELDFGIIRNDRTTLAYQFIDYQMLEILDVNRKLITPGYYTIHIEYNGEFSKNGEGFFKAKFTRNKEVLSYLAVTDFEPTHARRTFPCFDEPAFKAKFQLTLITPNSTYYAISNMRAIKTFEISNGVVYKFETTKPMSSYLVAFAITKYTYGEYTCCGRVPIRAYSFNANDEDCKQVLEFAHKSLEFFTTYTSYNYPLPKIDMIEYDREGSIGTENWGLITLDTGVLSNASKFFKEQKLNIIAHEIAHFWFGNLVTNDWWDDIWLQEGFAVFMALKAEENIANNNATDRFSKDYLEDSVYWSDLRNPSRPIVNSVETPLEIRENFNDISYVKGAAVLQMIEMIIGEKNFQKAITKYICQYAFKSASTNDLLNIMEEFTPYKVDLRGFVNSYLYQNRYPLIYVDEDENNYILKQISCGHRYSNDTETSFGYKWTIPVTYRTNLNLDLNSQPIIWFDKDMENLTIPKNNETWAKFNYRGKGLYRVSYSDNLWAKFIEYGHELDIKERDQLLLEAIQLYEANIISCNISINYLEQLTRTITPPVHLDTIFVAYVKMKKLARYDQDAFRLLSDLIYTILEKAGKKTTINLYSVGDRKCDIQTVV